MTPYTEDKIDDEALAQMKERGGTWAVYQNIALDSANMGHLQFLKVGEGCTFTTPPKRYPKDNEHGMGWRYVHVGMVNLEAGDIKKETTDD
jgi:hypothetical protein